MVLVGAQDLLGRAPLSLWVPGMMMAYGLMWGVIRVGTALDWRWVTHMSARAFIVAELAAVPRLAGRRLLPRRQALLAPGVPL